MIKSEVIIRKVWRSELSSIAIFVFLSILCVVLSRRFTFLTLRDHLFTLGNYEFWLAIPILAIIPLISLGMAIYKIYNVIYKVDNRGIESTVGRFSLKQSVNRVRYEDIRAIDIHQTILERMLDVGTIEISTAASSDSEVFLEGIDKPYEIKEQLEIERDSRRRNELKAVGNNQ